MPFEKGHSIGRPIGLALATAKKSPSGGTSFTAEEIIDDSQRCRLGAAYASCMYGST